MTKINNSLKFIYREENLIKNAKEKVNKNS